MPTATDNAQLALDTILQKPNKRIPTSFVHIMEHSIIERLAGTSPGSYVKDPHGVYIAMVRNIGTCLLDQYLAENPLSMGSAGYESAEHGATTGAEEIILDGITIDSPEAVVDHLERVAFPAIRAAVATFDGDAHVRWILDEESRIQDMLGPEVLKSGYGFVGFPLLPYFTYGYVNYFSAYALYPDVMERHFSLQADLAVLRNQAAARVYTEGSLPPLYRLDFDIADSRGTLVNIKTLDDIWFPHFARALEPMLKTDVKMIWHCDGNLMEMVPRLLDCGIKGFQGFQYEDGMDYAKICRMKTRDGEDLIIQGGVSVTRTLPMGTPDDVKREIDFLVEYGPKTGLFLNASSSVAPGVPWENIKTMVEGLNYYRTQGRHS